MKNLKMFSVADLTHTKDVLLRSEFGEHVVGHKLNVTNPDGSPLFFCQVPLTGKPVAWYPLEVFTDPGEEPKIDPTLRPIPVDVAARILEDYNKDEVFIIAWQDHPRCVHITTAGSSIEHKQNAAKGSKALFDHLVKKGIIDPKDPGTVFEDPLGLLEGK